MLCLHEKLSSRVFIHSLFSADNCLLSSFRESIILYSRYAGFFNVYWCFIKRITYISIIIFNFTINYIFELRFNIFNYFWMIHYHKLSTILSLICLSSFILSYLLSFMFAMCFLLKSDSIILLISSSCSSNGRICSNVLYSINWLRITFAIIFIAKTFYFFIVFYFFIFLFIFWMRSMYFC